MGHHSHKWRHGRWRKNHKKWKGAWLEETIPKRQKTSKSGHYTTSGDLPCLNEGDWRGVGKKWFELVKFNWRNLPCEYFILWALHPPYGLKRSLKKQFSLTVETTYVIELVCQFTYVF